MPEQSRMLDLFIIVGGAAFSASGETQVVLDAYADFKAFVGTTSVAQPPAPEPPVEEASAEKEDATPSDSIPEKVKSPTTLPLKPYLARLKLRVNKEKATAIVAWSGESGGKAALKVAEVEQLWKKTPFRAPSNLPRDIRAAEAEGWLDSQGKSGSPEATYSINGYGEGIVAGWVTTNKE